jgi:uncharacterized membrane protein YdjX (TVP38/TMEM64 family)
MSEPATSSEAAPRQPGGAGAVWGKRVALAAAIVGVVLLAREAGAYVPRFAAWVDGLGVWGPLVFVAGYVVATVALIPGSALTLAAGAVFGLFEGTLYAFVAASLGAAAAFLLGRHAARSLVERRIARSPRFAAIDRAVAQQGLRITFLLRLSPVFPFNLLNYVLGLTRVRFRDYLVACLGMLPGTLLYVYYGWVAGEVAAAVGGATERGAGGYAVQILGLLATIAVTVYVARLAQRALREETDGGLEEAAARAEE